MDKVRLTAHNGRLSKNGVFSRKHNDRHFDVLNSEHIDPAKVSDNKYWFFGRDDIGECESFDEHELKFYEKHFREALDKKNENPIKNRQYSRVMQMEDYISSPNACPEETIFQIGKCSDEGKADAAALTNIFQEYVEWHNKKYPQAVFLDAALHADEPDCAPHFHIRKVWIAHKDGYEIVNQGKSLEEMGVERPFTDKKKGRHNNPKITYTMDCRENLIEISKSYGFDIEEKPLETSKTGLAKLDNDAKEAVRKRDETLAEEATIRATITELNDNVIHTIVPERVGLFQKKTGNMVMNEETYEQVMAVGEFIKSASKEMLKTAKATETDRAVAAEERAKAEQSVYRQQLAIQAAAQKMLEENNAAELKARKEAEMELAEAQKLKALRQQEIKKGIAIGIKNANKAMAGYLMKLTLADGRNAYEAFNEEFLAKIIRRLDSAKSLVNLDIEKEADEKMKE